MNIARLLTLRPVVEALVLKAGESGLAIIKTDLATGSFTGALTFLQPDFNEVKAIVDFLEVLAEIKTALGL